MNNNITEPKIEGTVTISIDDFDKMRKKIEKLQEDLDYFQDRACSLCGTLEGMYEIDQEEWEKENRRIDAMRDINEKQLDKLVDENRSRIKIVLKKERVVELIKKYLPKVEELDIDDARREIKRSKQKDAGMFKIEIE